MFPSSTLAPTISSRSAEMLILVEALPTGEGAKAAAEPVRRERIAAVFMVVFNLFDQSKRQKAKAGRKGSALAKLERQILARLEARC